VETEAGVPKKKDEKVLMLSSTTADSGVWYLPTKREIMSNAIGNKYTRVVRLNL
jgi:hypothetical protein